MKGYSLRLRKRKGKAALSQGAQWSGQGALTLMMLSGALFMLRFLILTVSWWAVLQARRYLLIRGLGNSVPSKCFRPKANELRKGQQHSISLDNPSCKKASQTNSTFCNPHFLQLILVQVNGNSIENFRYSLNTKKYYASKTQ